MVLINQIRVDTLYNPGAAESLIGCTIWKKISSPLLQPTSILMAYTGLKMLDKLDTFCNFRYKDFMVSVQAFSMALELPATIERQNTVVNDSSTYADLVVVILYYYYFLVLPFLLPTYTECTMSSVQSKLSSLPSVQTQSCSSCCQYLCI